MSVLKNIVVLLCIPVCITFLVQSNRPPSINTQPDSIVYYKSGEAVQLPCKAGGFPTPTFSWKRNGIDFNPSGNDDRFTQLPGEGTLVINVPQDKDEGLFQCIATNSFGVSVSTLVQLRMGKLNDFPIGPSITHRTHLGESLVLNCIPPVSVPMADIIWVLRTPEGHIESINLNNRISMDFDGRLHIASVQTQDYQDGKAYVCMANNYFMRQNVYDKNQYINPMGSTPFNRPPQYSWASPSDMIGLKGQELKLKCIFSGNPTPDVIWLKDTVDLSHHYKVSLGGQELTIPSLTEHDAGTYECIGRSTNMPTASRSLNLRVQ
ncbi:neuroglian-like [Ostrea edulis]|uniref:neuroglian-like n=1 Tax=Ostrea edulis TaxID=37623 RepID=UPI0024AFC272|nr:neuroglian-like [Ostrea edulis]